MSVTPNGHVWQTKQEIFDAVVNHLLTMKQRSGEMMETRPYGSTFTCAYRTQDGQRCAIGALIPDNEYTPAIENKSVGPYESEVTELPCFAQVKNDTLALDLMGRLQELHDDPENWDENGFTNEDELKRLAEKFRLHYNS